MQGTDQALAKVERVIEQAKQCGADAADALYVGQRSSGVQVRKGELEDVSRSEGERVGLRIFVGQRSASASSSDLSDAALGELAERVAAMAREAPEDQYAGLAPEQILAEPPFADLDSADDAEPDPEALKERALAVEAAALGIEGVTNSHGGNASASGSTWAMATSHGFSGAYRSTSHGCSASVVAGEGSTMQRDYAWHSARHLEDVESPDEIGRRAGERAVARLNPIKIKPGKMPVLFEPRLSSSLLTHFVGAITGQSVARKSSFLQDSLGERVFAEGITIKDDPLRKRGLRSRPFDAEGLPVAKMAFVEDGVLKTWIAESASARQLDIDPTGHAVRGVGGAPGAGPSNLYLEAGTRSAADMIADLPRVLVLCELIGMGVNGVTGDYSRGAAGFLYEKGELVGPVSEITVASNLKDMFASLKPANDLLFRRGIDAPTVLVPEMTVGSA